jgi:hypothetical protein
VLKLFKLVFMSCRYDVGFMILVTEGDNAFWDSLLMFVLCAMDDYSRTIVTSSGVHTELQNWNNIQ